MRLEVFCKRHLPNHALGVARSGSTALSAFLGWGVTVLLWAKAPPRVRLWRGHAELAVRDQGRRLHQGLSDMSEKQAQSRAAATPPCHSTHLVPSPAAVPRPQPNDIRGLEPGFP